MYSQVDAPAWTGALEFSVGNPMDPSRRSLLVGSSLSLNSCESIAACVAAAFNAYVDADAYPFDLNSRTS